jgi:hypothetical protein
VRPGCSANHAGHSGGLWLVLRQPCGAPILAMMSDTSGRHSSACDGQGQSRGHGAGVELASIGHLDVRHDPRHSVKATFSEPGQAGRTAPPPGFEGREFLGPTRT